jgi:hypothetical protein
MNNYKQKYQKYKLKYIELKNKNNKTIGGDGFNFQNINDQAINDKVINDQVINDQVINYKMKLLNEKKSIYNSDLDESIIDFDFAKNIIDGKINYNVDDNNILNINIESNIYYSMNIYNNTLSVPGLSIYLKDSFDNELDVEKIHKLLENKINGKHILFIPFQKQISGIKLKDLAEILKLNHLNSKEFIVNVKLIGKKILNELKTEIKKSKYGIININDQEAEYNDYIDVDMYLNI